MKIKGHMNGRQVDVDVCLTKKEKKDIARFIFVITGMYSATMSKTIKEEIAEVMKK